MGTDLFQFASAGAYVSGIDITPNHLEIARKRFSLYGIRADVMLADAENMAFEDGIFDMVYSFGVIHHIPDTEKAISEIYRILKPDGRVFIGVYHKYSAFSLFSVHMRYILKMTFLHESYQRALSKIEYRENSDACPLVKMYSRKGLRNMLNSFTDVRIESKHITRSHFWRFKMFLSERVISKLEKNLGWFLIAECIK